MEQKNQQIPLAGCGSAERPAATGGAIFHFPFKPHLSNKQTNGTRKKEKKKTLKHTLKTSNGACRWEPIRVDVPSHCIQGLANRTLCQVAMSSSQKYQREQWEREEGGGASEG